jgi:hypothetical protein
MKRFHFVLLVLAVSALCSCATKSSGPTAASASLSASPAATVTAAATAETIIELEKKAWELAKNKQMDEFRQLLVPEYRTIYQGKIWNLDECIKDLMQTDIKSYLLSDMRVTFPVKDTAILTYRVDAVTVVSGKELKDPLYCSSVWVNIDGQWKGAVYTESPVATPKK